MANLAGASLAAALGALAILFRLIPSASDAHVSDQLPRIATYAIFDGEGVVTYRYTRSGDAWIETVIDARTEHGIPKRGDTQSFANGCYSYSSPAQPRRDFSGCDLEAVAPRQELSRSFREELADAISRQPLVPVIDLVPCTVHRCPSLASTTVTGLTGFEGAVRVMIDLERRLPVFIGSAADTSYAFWLLCSDIGPRPCDT